MLKEGQSAPDFTVQDQNGKDVSLSDFAGKWVVLYFYPKDDTPGCTVEAIDFTKFSDSFAKLKAVVLGLSPDSCASHQKFIKARNLAVRLLSDPEKAVHAQYDVWGKRNLWGANTWARSARRSLSTPRARLSKSGKTSRLRTTQRTC
jgi:peroxiredoxin Q/BCP